ncbi:choice-of-anchor D domain-containing protein [Conexibacter stalactiti]|uniref:Choice-of-anchor D domain-containing protein n=1 Tax=Conexibacter stalactiti TaxID=1940611 RepID=A0ABU4HVL2_9ACTN|nr:choice-of-anchor D domain-containing protein [Conexibacter stalactiti]MDW5597363.1 choice-of-anchor D domain-containing protein [Conexibacter stalactiti]MEC5038005.1 choice-of-anchor D domain-containing protein [Conexibacter stalactiti]
MPLLISAPLAFAALPAAAQAGSFTLGGYGCAGNEWTVPDGVTSIRLVAQGERGGNSGGYGARITASVDVTPGTVLYACVGVNGGDGGTGPGGTGGGGGGYTSVSSHADGSIPWIVAAGGGGKGAGPNAGDGGAAGTYNTEAGSGVASGSAGAGRRTDGSSGGAGGVNSADASANGTAGLRARGGDGGSSAAGPGGGAGGAGVWGGGGGAGSATSEDGSAGGGGGYSFCGAGATGCASTNDPSSPSVEFSWAEPVATTTTVSLNTSRAISGHAVKLRATVSPVPSGGTVAFTVDGNRQWDCDAVAVDTTTGVAECDTNIPGARGAHSVRAVYSGVSSAFDGSDDDESFTVYGGVPSVSPSPTAAFGEVELGKSTTRPITVTNVGDADLTIDEIDGIYIAEYEPRARPPRSTEFIALDDQCTNRTLAVGASCVVVVKFSPRALGQRTAVIDVYSDAWDGTDEVELTGVGVEARPEPEPKPEERKPETPSTPVTPVTPVPSPVQPPAVPTAPAPPAVQTRAPPAVGASVDLGVSRGAQVTQNGSVRLPLVCPVGQPCRVSGTLTLALTGGQARAAAATKTRVLVRFSGIKVAAGKTKTLSLNLPAAFVKAQQAKGVRRLRTTLTVKTTLGSGRTVTRRQAITLLIPRARVAQRAAPQPAQRPSFTG